MIQSFQEYIDNKKQMEEHAGCSLHEKNEGSDDMMTDKDGPCKGKPFSKVGSEGHLSAMQYHSSKFNAIKNGKAHSDSDHVKKAGIDFHTKMYLAHKKALNKDEA